LGQGDRLGQGGHRSGVLPAGGQPRRPLRLHLDEVTNPGPGDRQCVQVLEQPGCLVGSVLREQHQMRRLVRVGRLVVRAAAALPRDLRWSQVVQLDRLGSAGSSVRHVIASSGRPRCGHQLL
jgi:hypothetical protein